MVHLKLLNHVLFLIFVFKGVRARGEATIIVLNEGDELVLNCSTVPEKFNIIFPRNNSDSLISTSEHEIVPHIASGQIVHWTFRRKKTVFGDTGQYTFVYVANGTRQHSQHYQLIVNYDYFYVYIRSMKNLFVSTRYDNLIMVSPNSSIVIPCRPTSPELQVQLINSTTNEKVNFSESIKFDPKIGFIINLTSASASSYLCRTELDLVSAQLSFTVIVTGNYARRVHISAKKIDHLVIGQTLKLNCTVVLSTVDAAKDHVFWTTPRNTVTMRKSIMKHKNGNVIFNTELTVKNLTFNDIGLYTCDTNTSLVQKDESIFITVYNDIEVKSSHKSRDIVESMKLKLECISWYGHSLRTMEWLNKNNETIVNDERVEVFHSDEIGETIAESFLIKRTFLHINNISKSDEGAVYTCLVNNFKNSTKSISYKVASVHKPEAPYIEKTNMKGKQVVLYVPAKNVSKILYCVIKGMPRPKTTWYKNDLPLNMSNTKIIDLIYIRSSPELLQLLFTKADSGGIYKCRGTNSFGMVEASTEFIVIEKDLPAFWNITITWFILVCSMFVAFLTVKVLYDMTRKRALAEIGLLPFPQEDGQILRLSLANQQEEVRYDPKQWEFKRTSLTFGDQLSSGGFGIMLKAQVRSYLKDEVTSTVAVKKVLPKSGRIHREATAIEFKTHIYMGSHENIVRILGICADKIIKGELLLIMEYCQHGNLLDYMLRNKSEFVDQIDPVTGKIDCTLTAPLGEGEIANPDDHSADLSDVRSIGASYPQPGWRTNYSIDTEGEKREMFCTQDLNYWAYQISYAMDYLHEKKIIHGDLAARNVLLVEEQVIKICDLGIAKTMCSDYDYRNEYSESFPIKWMAVESMKSNTFSLQSDLWSYAVTLWEIYSFAEEPYPGIPDHEIYDKLVSGYRMEKPRYAVKEVYDIMFACWSEDPVSRPSFAEIAQRLKEHAVEVTKQSAAAEVPSASNPSTDADAPSDAPKDSEVEPKD